MSPVLYKGNAVPSSAELANLDLIFKSENVSLERYSAKGNYFGLASGATQTEARTFDGFDHYRKIFYCFFDSVQFVDLFPKSFAVHTSEYFDLRLHSKHLNQLAINFSQDAVFRAAFENMLASIPGRAYVTVIFNENRETVASGAFLIYETNSLLVSGSVSEQFRGKNYSRLLVEERKKASLALGATSWMYSTSNPKMASYFDDQLIVDHYVQSIPAKAKTPKIAAEL